MNAIYLSVVLQFLDINDGNKDGSTTRDVADRGGEDVSCVRQLLEKSCVFASFLCLSIDFAGLCLLFYEAVYSPIADLALEVNYTDTIKEREIVSDSSLGVNKTSQEERECVRQFRNECKGSTEPCYTPPSLEEESLRQRLNPVLERGAYLISSIGSSLEVLTKVCWRIVRDAVEKTVT